MIDDCGVYSVLSWREAKILVCFHMFRFVSLLLANERVFKESTGCEKIEQEKADLNFRVWLAFSSEIKRKLNYQISK